MEEAMLYRNILSNIISYIRNIRENDSEEFDLDEFIVEMMLIAKTENICLLD